MPCVDDRSTTSWCTSGQTNVFHHQRIFTTTCIENRISSSNIKFNMNSTNNSNVAGDGNSGGHSLAYAQTTEYLAELESLHELREVVSRINNHSLVAKIDKRIKILEDILFTGIAPCV